MDQIISDIAKKLEIDEEVVNKVVRSQFKFVKDVMESGNMDSIHLSYFGKIAVKPNRLTYLSEDFLDNIYKSGKEIK